MNPSESLDMDATSAEHRCIVPALSLAPAASWSSAQVCKSCRGFMATNECKLNTFSLTSLGLNVLLCKMGENPPYLPGFGWRGLKETRQVRHLAQWPAQNTSLTSSRHLQRLIIWAPGRHGRHCACPWQGHTCIRSTGKLGISQHPPGCPEAAQKGWFRRHVFFAVSLFNLLCFDFSICY